MEGQSNMSTHPIDKLDLRQLGQELKNARKRRKLTQEDAAKIIDVARTTITAIEAGARKIRSEELVELARAYGKSVSDFLRPRPVFEPFHTVQFRGPTEQTGTHQEKIERSKLLFEDLCRNHLELERITNTSSIRHYPPEYQRKGTNLELEAEGLAQAERNRLGLGDAPLPPVRDILEQDVGINVFYLPLDPGSLSGIYYYSEELGGCIAINSQHPEERCRWTMCHDYCHFLADRYEPTVLFYEGYQRQPASERFADLFAKYFLMPTSSVTQRFNEIYAQKNGMTPGGLCILANRFGVSVEALTRRLEDLRLMKAGAWERLQRNGAKIRDFQEELQLAPVPGRQDTFPVRYRQMALDAYHRGKISEGQLATFLQLEQRDVRKLVATMPEQSRAAKDETEEMDDVLEDALHE
jgi:Zn-dependent peptidase ImmA (M78 family)/DNA-binding XRE family transcriptional regulator